MKLFDHVVCLLTAVDCETAVVMLYSVPMLIKLQA